MLKALNIKVKGAENLVLNSRTLFLYRFEGPSITNFNRLLISKSQNLSRTLYPLFTCIKNLAQAKPNTIIIAHSFYRRNELRYKFIKFMILKIHSFNITDIQIKFISIIAN